MRDDLLTFRRGLTFVTCSIRQSIVNVPDQIAALWDNAAYDEHPLFGFKWHTWEYILSDNAQALFDRIRGDYDPERLILAVSELPGIGIVKGAFVAQLMGANVACLDSRNVKRDNRPPRQYRSDGERKNTAAYKRKIARYVADVGGKAEVYWNEWCADVAPRYGMTPDEVSALHSSILPPNYIPF